MFLIVSPLVQNFSKYGEQIGHRLELLFSRMCHLSQLTINLTKKEKKQLRDSSIFDPRSRPQSRPVVITIFTQIVRPSQNFKVTQ